MLPIGNRIGIYTFLYGVRSIYSRICYPSFLVVLIYVHLVQQMNFRCSSQLVVLLSPQPTPSNRFRAEGLNPYLEYELDVSALNEFTMLNLPLIFDPGFGRDVLVRTLEGGLLVCMCVCVCVCV